MNFNFDNLYIIGNKKDITDTKKEYELNCYLNELNEIYTFIWDDEEALIKWKIANSIEVEHHAVELDSFLGIIILPNTEVKRYMSMNLRH